MRREITAPFSSEPYGQDHRLAQWLELREGALTPGQFVWLEDSEEHPIKRPAVFEKEWQGFYWFYVGRGPEDARRNALNRDVEHRMRYPFDDPPKVLDTGGRSSDYWGTATYALANSGRRAPDTLLAALKEFPPGTLMRAEVRSEGDGKVSERYVLYIGDRGGFPLALSVSGLSGRRGQEDGEEFRRRIEHSHPDREWLLDDREEEVWKRMWSLSPNAIVQVVGMPTAVLRQGFGGRKV